MASRPFRRAVVQIPPGCKSERFVGAAARLLSPGGVITQCQWSWQPDSRSLKAVWRTQFSNLRDPPAILRESRARNSQPLTERDDDGRVSFESQSVITACLSHKESLTTTSAAQCHRNRWSRRTRQADSVWVRLCGGLSPDSCEPKGCGWGCRHSRTLRSAGCRRRVGVGRGDVPREGA